MIKTVKVGNRSFSMKSDRTFSPSKDDNKLTEEKIFDYISSHYYLATSDFLRTAPLNKSKLKIDLSTSPPTVDCTGSLVFHGDESTLTNGMFQWGSVSGGFRCAYRKSLISLEGSPKKVGGKFDCSNCKSLKSLKGSPKEVSGDFNCSQCESLKSLEGAPKEVGGDFDCYYCLSLTSLEGAPKEVGGDFSCGYCRSLKSVKGAPKEVGGTFYCFNCGVRFAQSDVKKISNVKNGVLNIQL